LAPQRKGAQAAFYDPSCHTYDSSRFSLSLADGNRMVEEFEAFTARMQSEKNRDVY
jgi:hypothetical protein